MPSEKALFFRLGISIRPSGTLSRQPDSGFAEANLSGSHWTLPPHPPHPDYPNAGHNHSNPAHCPHDGGDLYVVIHDVPTSENCRPIMAASADKRQDLRPRI